MIVALSALAALVGAGVAAIAGFGLGSLVTPVLSVSLGIKLAVAVVALPHLVASALRLATLWPRVDRRIFLRFGLASAAGGLAGALAHVYVSARPLLLVFGVLLLVAGIAGVAGVSGRLRLPPRWLAVGGVLSGLLGGLVGNQGGIRSAALLGSPLAKESFVATATATAVLVDVVRIPVYLAYEGGDVWRQRATLGWLTLAAVAGTIVGRLLLVRLPEGAFRRVVGGVLVALGGFMLYQGVRAA